MRTPSPLLPCLALLLAAALLCGCASIGPGSVNRDRFDYNVALTDDSSHESQLQPTVVTL